MNDTEYTKSTHGCLNRDSSTSFLSVDSTVESGKSMQYKNIVGRPLSQESFKKEYQKTYPSLCIRSSHRDKPRVNAHKNWDVDDLSMEDEVDHVAELLGYKQEGAQLENEKNMNESVWVKRKRAAVARSEWLTQPLFRNTPCVMSVELEDGISNVGGGLDEYGFPSGRQDVKQNTSGNTTTMWWMNF